MESKIMFLLRSVLIVSVLTVSWISCSDDIEEWNDSKSTIPDKSLETKSGGIDLDGLSGFQTYLRELYGGENPVNAYSLEDAVTGVESLMNIGCTRFKQGIHYSVNLDTPLVNIQGNWWDLFNHCTNSVYNATQSIEFQDMDLVAIDLEVKSVEGQQVTIAVKSFFKDKENVVLDIDPFSDHYLGHLGWGELDGFNADPIYPDGCPALGFGCGSLPPFEKPDEEEEFAMEAVENHLNSFFPDVQDINCAPNQEGDRLVFLNIEFEKGLSIEWEPDLGLPPFSFYPQDCLSGFLLGEVYVQCKEALEENLGVPPFYVTYPHENEVMICDLGVLFVTSGGDACFYGTGLSFDYLHGRPFCVNGEILEPGETTAILNMDISDLLTTP